jgi:CheY-like chemotaxis protein
MSAPGSPCGSTRIRHKLDGRPLMLIPRQTGNPTVAKILVVVDDPVMQMTIRLLLERTGYGVVVANDGHKTGHFDLVCLDIFMPTMDGLETMKLVRELQPADCLAAATNKSAPDSNVAARR